MGASRAEVGLARLLLLISPSAHLTALISSLSLFICFFCGSRCPSPLDCQLPGAETTVLFALLYPGLRAVLPQSFVHLCWVMKFAPRVPQSAQYPYEHAESASKYLGIHFMPEDSSATRKKG